MWFILNNVHALLTPWSFLTYLPQVCPGVHRNWAPSNRPPKAYWKEPLTPRLAVTSLNVTTAETPTGIHRQQLGLSWELLLVDVRVHLS